MSSVTGKDMIDLMAEGIESFVKARIHKELVARLVAEFETEIDVIVSDKLAEMAFKAHSGQNLTSMSRELIVLIEWCKAQPEYKTKYTMQREVIEKDEGK